MLIILRYTHSGMCRHMYVQLSLAEHKSDLIKEL